MIASAVSTSPYDKPAHETPPGVDPNYDNPVTLMGWIIGVGVSSMGLMLLAMVARMFTKLFLMKEWRHEDCKSNLTP